MCIAFVCVCVCSMMYMCVVYECKYLQRPEEGILSIGVGVR